MADWYEMDSEQQASWREWVASRPPVVREMAERFLPNKLYRLTTSNHRVTVCGFGEDGTMTVAVTGQFNRVMFERRVFGIQPEDLEECELPGSDEVLGAVLTEREDIDAHIAELRSTGEFGGR